jgi:hypothetical protein
VPAAGVFIEGKQRLLSIKFVLHAVRQSTGDLLDQLRKRAPIDTQRNPTTLLLQTGTVTKHRTGARKDSSHFGPNHRNFFIIGAIERYRHVEARPHQREELLVQRILVRRAGAFGDVLCVTPVVRRLREGNPSAEIDVDTQYPQVFRNSPHRIGIKRDVVYDRVIDLNMALERNRRVGIVESYMEVAFGDRDGSTRLEMHYGPPPEFGLDWSLAIAMHPARSWPQRTLPISFWIDLANLLAKRGWIVLCIGTKQDWGFNGHRVLDLRERLDMETQAAVIGASRAFVCSDSGPMILAQVTNVPIIALLTISLPWMAAMERNGEVGWRFRGISSPIECVGCTHRVSEAATFFSCERGDNKCVTLFDAVAIANEVERAAREAASA